MIIPSSNFYDPLRSLILPLIQIDKALPKKGKIVDLGCGEGVIAKFIAKEKNRMVIGVDLDKKRLKKTNHKNLKFEHDDIRKYNLKGPNGVILSDVLHHLSFKDQEKLLKKISKNLNKEGVLIIKEIDAGEFVRSKLSRFWDFILYPKDKIYYNDSNKLKNNLNNLGFKVEITRSCRLFPGSTTLFICQK